VIFSSIRLYDPYERHFLAVWRDAVIETAVVQFLKWRCFCCEVTEYCDVIIDCVVVKGEKASRQGQPVSPGSMICILPNQGILEPFEKTPVFFRFSPRSVALHPVVMNRSRMT